METLKVRYKVGIHEFEGEGPTAAVTKEREAWEILIAAGSLAAKLPEQPREPVTATPSNGHGTVTVVDPFVPPPADALSDEAVMNVFRVDDKRGLVTLRAHPTGETRDPDAVLLTIYGFKRLMSQDEILVGRIKDALEESGIRLDRVDRVIDAYRKQGYLLKAGQGKGGKYRLTTTGFPKAEGIAKSLAEQMM